MPCALQRPSGRMTALCSIAVVMIWQPGNAEAITILIASVAFLVNARRMES